MTTLVLAANHDIDDHADSSGLRQRFEGIWADHYDDIVKYALRRGCGDASEDVAARTFTVAWRKLATLTSEPAPWLYGIARRVMLEEYRSQQRLDRLIKKASEGEPFACLWSADPVVVLSARENTVEVLTILSELSELDREIMMLTAWEGMPVRAVAEIIGRPAALVSVRLHRAKKRLIKLRTAQIMDEQLEHNNE